eukprot:TRINITY_DN18016_c0_g1_i1.p1 TRINITY_DN18016_c0_g1~~TRINITY_DN18016_c0_g1_i1.p1  ORF type:complete len:894 (-),score=164.80 TRINITY_DN18016_c0_g1_i1:31-2712(-)
MYPRVTFEFAFLKVHGSQDGLVSCAFSAPSFEEIVVDLLQYRGKRVEVWGSSDGSKRGASSTGGKWERIKHGSPGNFREFEDLIVGSGEGSGAGAPVVMAVVHSPENGRTRFGCAYCNGTQRLLGVAQFLDADQFLNLEAFIIQIGARECLVTAASESSASPEDRQVEDILLRTGVVRTEVKRSEFSGKDTEQGLTFLLDEAASGPSLPYLELTSAAQALGCLIRFLDLTSDETNAQQFRIRQEDLQHFMRLDAAAVQALALFPESLAPQEMAGSANRGGASLYGLLNRCLTAMGQRALRQWLTQPLLDVGEIRKRQDLVEVFADDPLFCGSVREEVLRHVPDLEQVVKKLQRRRAKLEDTVLIGRFLQHVPKLVDILSQYGGAHAALLRAEVLEPLSEISGHFDNLQRLISSTLDTSGPDVIICSAFDDELEELARQRRGVDMTINREYKRILQELGAQEKFCKLERMPQHCGFVVRIHRTKGNEQRDAFDAGSEFEVLSTNKQGTLFTTLTLKRVNQDYNELLRAYQQRQLDLERKYLATVASYIPVLEDVKFYLAYVDLLTTFANVSCDAPIPYVRPTVLPATERVFHVEQARHPMLEVQAQAGGSNAAGAGGVIPNDFNLDGDANLVIVTGPNMGGKSTYLRTAGVLQLMAQIGMFLPCRAATLSVRDHVLARVGATDCLARGVSTFMAEMLETATILTHATPQSLVIIDELGRGTSTYDGFGLAWAIAEALANEAGAFCLFATHFHELTHLAAKSPNVRNLHVTAAATDTSITMLYQLQPGPCSKSFGIHVAELAHFPPEVVACAKKKAMELETFEATGLQTSEPGAKRRRKEDPRIAKLLEYFVNGHIEENTLATIAAEVEATVQNCSDLLLLATSQANRRLKQGRE